MKQAITEASNPLTRNLDIADQTAIIRMLRQSDAQLFSGYEHHPSVMDEEMIESIARAAFRLSRILVDTDSYVYMSGAGTSGRLAALLSIQFNEVLRSRKMREVFKPLVAGGEAALIMAQESAEDSIQKSVDDLKAALPEEYTQAMYIGITCGLSAPYVAGQLDTTLKDKKFQSVVVGFNPLETARNVKIEGWDRTVHEVLTQAEENDQYILLNPVYGPEPVTGSTRMKGGSMTKIVIESVFMAALWVLDNAEEQSTPLGEENLLPLRDVILSKLHGYNRAMLSAYQNIPALSEIVRMAGTALRSGGRIHYLGRGSAGFLGIVDASECPPTFGADIYDVRGYIREGWEYIGYNSSQMKTKGKPYEIDHDDFEKKILPEIAKGDLVVGIAIGKVGESTAKLLKATHDAKANTALILVTSETNPKVSSDLSFLTETCVLRVERLGHAPAIVNEAELTLKLALNAITTGGHIIAGKVYGNVMIDLRISNNKLYYRAIGLIARLLNISDKEAQKALHFAIFEQPSSEEEIQNFSVAMCVQRAIKQPKIIPLSILLATGKFTYEQAKERLASEPRVRHIIEEAIGSSNDSQF